MLWLTWLVRWYAKVYDFSLHAIKEREQRNGGKSGDTQSTKWTRNLTFFLGKNGNFYFNLNSQTFIFFEIFCWFYQLFVHNYFLCKTSILSILGHLKTILNIFVRVKVLEEHFYSVTLKMVPSLPFDDDITLATSFLLVSTWLWPAKVIYCILFYKLNYCVWPITRVYCITSTICVNFLRFLLFEWSDYLIFDGNVMIVSW